MLFGRKNPPAGAPKPESAAPAAQPVAAPASRPAPPSALSAAPSAASTPLPPTSDKGPEMNTSTPKPPMGQPAAGAMPASAPSGAKTDVPRRVVDMPGARPGFGAPAAAPAPATQAAPAPAPAAPLSNDQRRLIVGRDISLAGEIGSCDVLVVEGTVEAKLREGRSIEIAETGLFKGSVEIEEADIAGRFEGDISVRGRLRVRSTGKITGSIRYGELAVEAGGQLSGDVQTIGAAKTAPAAPAPAAAPAPVQTQFASAGE